MHLRLYRAEGRKRASRLLVLVHNYGGNEFQMAMLGMLLDPGGRFSVVCPRGPIDTEDAADGASFYRIDRATHTYDLPSFAAALDALDEALDLACDTGGFARHEAVLGGFSQGGGLALALALRRSTRARPAGVIALSAPVHPRERVEWDLPAARAVPVFLAHGSEDRTFPADAAEAFAAELRATGNEVMWHRHPIRHQVTLEVLAQARDWLAAR